MTDAARQAGASLAGWLTGRGEGVALGVLRERQWVQSSAGGLILVMPACFMWGAA